jgi:hypothetical protein
MPFAILYHFFVAQRRGRKRAHAMERPLVSDVMM